MDEARSTDYQFQHKQTLFGIVLMYREAVPANGYGDFEWGRWRKARWSDMTQRGQFEAVLPTLGGHSMQLLFNNTVQREDGLYKTIAVECAWRGWQAAQAQAAAPDTANPIVYAGCAPDDSWYRGKAAVEPVGEIVEVTTDGSFQAGFFTSLPAGTKLYTSPPDADHSAEIEMLRSAIDAHKEAQRAALDNSVKQQKAMRMALDVLKDERIYNIESYEAWVVRRNAAIAALEGSLK